MHLYILNFYYLQEEIWLPMPTLIFGSVSLFTGFMCFLLPETKGKRLPDTLEEAEAIGRLRRRKTDYANEPTISETNADTTIRQRKPIAADLKENGYNSMAFEDLQFDNNSAGVSWYDNKSFDESIRL